MKGWHNTALAFALAGVLACGLCACGGGGDSGGGDAGGGQDSTSGEAFSAPGAVESPQFDPAGAVTENDGSIDTSSLSQGVVMASAKSASRLKLLVTCGEMSYNYDLPGDGTPITCPINMGDGSYTFAIMRNTGGNNYVETTSTTADVKLNSEFIPFTQPNMYCDYTEDSPCVAKARELTANAQNQGDAVKAVCNYITQNVSYDTDKAAQLSGTTGYVPNPDETLSSGKGICFDYASLGAAMLRSVGIPTKIVTGYVSPEDLYHAWIMVYIDGSWTSAQFSVNPQSWSRVDLTFASDPESVGLVGDGKTYTERYVY
ncbi:MAG: transglutaminase-like domain-containing protein [Coriobacteriales bacterium]|nr:transglutaminase-like domain-containing protein [Coriobacteriales bacterium]